MECEVRYEYCVVSSQYILLTTYRKCDGLWRDWWFVVVVVCWLGGWSDFVLFWRSCKGKLLLR